MELFANHCRLCRSENDPAESWPQLTKPGNEHLLEKIQACTGVQIQADDDLPKRICRRCEASLDQADTFRLQCREADAWWRFNFGESIAKPVPITSIYVKPEVVEEDDLEGGSDQPVGVETVLKEEPPMKTEDSDYEPDKNESSSDETEKVSSKKKKQNKKVTRKKRGRTDFRCSVCSKHFLQRCALDEHEARHAGIRNFECTLCDSKFFGVTGLKRHTVQKHSTVLPFQCDKCDRKFSVKKLLDAHLLSHSEERPFSCEQCPKAFKKQAQLNAHMKYVHQPQEVKDARKKAFERICICSYCGHVSKTVTNHKIHLRVHTGEKKYECQICNKRFSAPFSYRNHLRVHTDERPFQCQHCEKAFRNRNHLITHIRALHTNERPFQCRFCPKAFVTRQSMQIHEKTHGEPVVGMECI